MKSVTEELSEFWKENKEIITEYNRLVKKSEQEKAESLVGKWLETEEYLNGEKTFILVLKPKGIGIYAFTYDIHSNGIEYNERKLEQLFSLKEANQKDLENTIQLLVKRISYVKEGRFSDIKKDLGIK